MTTHEIITSKPKLPVYFDIYQSDNQLVPSHWHAHVEILYISSGSMHVICREESFLLHAGDIFLVNSGDIHYTRTIGRTETYLLQIPFDFFNQMLPGFASIRFQEYFSAEKYKNDPVFCEMRDHLLTMGYLYKNEKMATSFIWQPPSSFSLYTLYFLRPATVTEYRLAGYQNAHKAERYHNLCGKALYGTALPLGYLRPFCTQSRILLPFL